MVIEPGKYVMTQNPMPNAGTKDQPQNTPARPNEQGVLNIDEFLRISDPETKQVFVEQRA